MSKGGGRTPDYNLSALDKDTDARGKVGAAWINEDGSIGIKLNMRVILDSRDNLELRLFPRDHVPRNQPQPPQEDEPF